MIAAAAIAVSAFSTKVDEQKSSFSQYWYQLLPSGDPGNYLDYERVGSQPCSGSSSDICGVFAEQYSAGDIEHPNLGQIAITVKKP